MKESLEKKWTAEDAEQVLLNLDSVVADFDKTIKEVPDMAEIKHCPATAKLRCY